MGRRQTSQSDLELIHYSISDFCRVIFVSQNFTWRLVLLLYSYASLDGALALALGAGAVKNGCLIQTRFHALVYACALCVIGRLRLDETVSLISWTTVRACGCLSLSDPARTESRWPGSLHARARCVTRNNRIQYKPERYTWYIWFMSQANQAKLSMMHLIRWVQQTKQHEHLYLCALGNWAWLWLPWLLKFNQARSNNHSTNQALGDPGCDHVALLGLSCLPNLLFVNTLQFRPKSIICLHLIFW